MRPVRIAVQIHPQHATYSDIRDAAGRVEDAGFDILYNWDHFFPLYGEADGNHFECWTMLGAWAEQTSQLEIGALVTCNSYRNPQLLADMARTVDHISGGRLILGMGSGWFERDYEEFGYEFGTAGGRLDALRDAMPLIETRLSKGIPAPQRDIPILIGGGGEKKTLRIVARHADIWHGFGQPDQVEHKLNVLRSWCEREGTDFDAIEVSIGIQKADEDLALADAYYELGVRQFTFGVNGPDYDISAATPWLAWRDSMNG